MTASQQSQQAHPYVVAGYGVFGDPDRVFSDKGGPIERFTHKYAEKDISVIQVTPARERNMDVRVVDSWMSMLKLPNQKYAPLWVVGMEVGAAYDATVELILSSPELSRFKYMLTIEEDNMPPPLGFVRLCEAAYDGAWDVLGGLYYVKGASGFAQIWGEPDDEAENYRSLNVKAGADSDEDMIVPCWGTGMGFTLFDLDVFRKVKPPWFRSQSDLDGVWTQDLHFFHQARAQGVPLKVGIHCGVRVGHMSRDGVIW